MNFSRDLRIEMQSNTHLRIPLVSKAHVCACNSPIDIVKHILCPEIHTRFVFCYVLLWFVSSQFTNTLQGHFTLAMRLSVTVAINYAIATVPVTINLSSVIHHQIGPNCYVAVNTNRIEALKSDVTMIISICSYTGTGRIATEACAKF